MGPEDRVVKAVVRYFSLPKFNRLSVETEYPVQIGVSRRRADVALIDEEENPSALIECKRIGFEGRGIDQLKGYLAAKDAPLGYLRIRWTPLIGDIIGTMGGTSLQRLIVLNLRQGFKEA